MYNDIAKHAKLFCYCCDGELADHEKRFGVCDTCDVTRRETEAMNNRMTATRVNSQDVALLFASLHLTSEALTKQILPKLDRFQADPDGELTVALEIAAHHIEKYLNEHRLVIHPINS